jgi:hypothetical protein
VFLTNSTNVPLLSLLREFRYRKAKDPRDKIFVLRNLAADFGENVSFSYKMDIEQLIEQVAIYPFRGTGFFWPIYCDLFSNANSDCPIWVPNWSVDGDTDDHLNFSGSSSAVLFYSACDISYDEEQKQIYSKESSHKPLVNGEHFRQYYSRLSSWQWLHYFQMGY